MTDYKELAQQALNEPDARKSLDLYNEAVVAAREAGEWEAFKKEMEGEE